MREKGVFGGLFLILCGVALFVGRALGYADVGFIYLVGLGVLMIALPSRKGSEPWRQRRRQIAGAWVALSGVIIGLVQHTSLTWAAASPLWLIGTGVLLLVTRASWSKEA